MTSDLYIGYSKAFYRASSRQRWWTSAWLILSTIPAAASILINDPKILYYLAIASGAFMGIWLYSRNKYVNLRDAAHSARRAALLTDAFSIDFSDAEKSYLQEKFHIMDSRAEALQDPDYYSSQTKPGNKRLLESIEESAFFTTRVQKICAKITASALLAYAALWLGTLFWHMPNGQTSDALLGARLFLSLTITILSGGLVGSWIAYNKCATETAEIVKRCIQARTNQPSHVDTLMILLEYSAAVDSSPEALPFVYRAKRNQMEKAWATSQGRRNA